MGDRVRISDRITFKERQQPEDGGKLPDGTSLYKMAGGGLVKIPPETRKGLGIVPAPSLLKEIKHGKETNAARVHPVRICGRY